MSFVKKIEPIPDTSDVDQAQLTSILSDPEQMASILEFNRRYLHWDELRYRVNDDEALAIWAIMKLLRNNGFNLLHVCDLDLTYTLLPEFQKLLHNIDCNSAGFTDIESPDEKNVKRYAATSLIEEAIASSQMEGAATTRKDAKKMLLVQRKPQTTSEKMIYNNYLAMEHIKNTLDRKMDKELILEMHKIIVNGTLSEGSEWEGRFREDDETVVGDTDREGVVFHVPPKYVLVPNLVQELCDFINDDSKEFVHPIIKGIIVHYLIGYIHPFVNGNGRLARSLYYWYVLKNGYWLMEYTSISRILKRSQAKYGLAYQYSETDNQDLTYFIRFNLFSIGKAVEDLKGYVEKKTTEQKKIIRLIGSNPELNNTEILILKDYSKEGGLFSIKELSTRYQVSYQTARNYIIHLHGLGYIQPASKDRKTVLYSLSNDKKVYGLR